MPAGTRHARLAAYDSDCTRGGPTARARGRRVDLADRPCYGVLTGSVSTQLPKLLGAATAQLPAAIVLPTVAVLLFGLLPWESTALAWTAVALVAVITVFGRPLQWPTWMMDTSPFTQIPKLPGGTVSAEPLLWLCAVALTISTVGLIGLRRRDLGDLGPSRPVGAIRDRIVAYASFELSRPAAEHGTAQPPK